MTGRPIAFDRRRITKRAMEEFWLHGFTGVSVKGLCETLGITRSSFYNTFGTLDALFDECLALYGQYSPAHRILQDRQQAGPDVSRAGKDIRRFFRELCAIRGNDTVNRGCLMVNTLAEMEELSPHIQDRLHVHGAVLPAFFHDLIMQGISANELPQETDTETLSRSLHMLALGINTMSRTIRNEAGLWAMADMTLTGLGIHDEATATQR